MFYDDGSSIEIGGDGTIYSTNVDGVAVSAVDRYGQISYTPGVSYASDIREAQKMEQFTARPAGDTSTPWYERVAVYGLSRAIDSHFQTTAIQKGSQAATYAGQNGQTYTNGVQSSTTSQNNFLMLLVVGAIAFMAVS